MKIKLTWLCNLRCRMCNVWRQSRENRLTLPVIRSLAGELAALGTQKVHLSGGVRKDDRAMVAFFRQQHPDLPLHIVPPQPNEALPPYYALCDVVILPSLRDGLPNTLLEAMACGRPVVASAVGGMLDVLTDGQDGILLPPQNDAAWVDTLRRLLRDPQAREQLGASARQTVVTRFTTEQELEATLAPIRRMRRTLTY